MTRLSMFGRLAKAACVPIAIAAARVMPAATPMATGVSRLEPDLYYTTRFGQPVDVFGEQWVAHGVNADGAFFSSLWMDEMPSGARLSQLVAQGFDRVEQWIGGVCKFQAPLVAGKLPVGWDSLEDAGPVEGIVPPRGIPWAYPASPFQPYAP